MIKLRKLLLCDIFFIIIFILSFIISFIRLDKTTYKVKGNIFKIVKINIENNKIQMILKDKYLIKAFYTIKDIDNLKFYKSLGINDKIYIDYNQIEFKETIKEVFNYKKYLRSFNIKEQIKINDIRLVSKNTNLYYMIKNSLIKKIESLDNSKYIKTFILGENNLDKDIKHKFTNLGISHLFAISGMHISIISMILIYIFKIIKIEEDKRYILVSIFLIFYMIISSFVPSLSRAVIFFVCLSINKIKYFYIKTINILLFSIVINLLIHPYFLTNIGFIYSSLITSSLILFSNKLNGSYFVILFKVSLLSSIVSFPITLYINSEINLLSVFNNLIFVPLVSIIIFPIILLNMIIPINIISSSLLWILEILINFFSNFHINIIMHKSLMFLIIYYFLLCIYAFTKYKKTSILLLILSLVIHYNYNYIFNIKRLYMIDVGQGDSFLLYDKKTSILIDTGGNYYKPNSIARMRTIPLLKALGIRKLDFIIVSHGDYDHIGEAKYIVENFKVSKVYFNNNPYNHNERKLIKILKKHHIDYEKFESLVRDNIKMININTLSNYNENDSSSVISIDFYNKSILFTGDMSVKTEKYINVSKHCILKVPHHGSITSTSEAFLDQISPKYGLISVGLYNKFKHPSETVLNRLKSRNIQVYESRYTGTIYLDLKHIKC